VIYVIRDCGLMAINITGIHTIYSNIFDCLKDLEDSFHGKLRRRPLLELSPRVVGDMVGEDKF